MARESVKILQGKLDVESLISQLNAALSEEWLAYYQYWVGALVVEGAMRADVQGEFEEHAEDPYWTRRNGSNWQDANMMLPKGLIL